MKIRSSLELIDITPKPKFKALEVDVQPNCYRVSLKCAAELLYITRATTSWLLTVEQPTSVFSAL